MFPPRWNLPQRRIDEFDLFMAGEAELHEPLPISRLGHRFQNGNAAGVVLDQVVIGGKE